MHTSSLPDRLQGLGVGGSDSARSAAGGFCARYSVPDESELRQFLECSGGGPIGGHWTAMSLAADPSDLSRSIVASMSEAYEFGYDGRMWIPIIEDPDDNTLVVRNDQSPLAGQVVFHYFDQDGPELVFASSITTAFDLIAAVVRAERANVEANPESDQDFDPGWLPSLDEVRKIDPGLRHVADDELYWSSR